LIEKFPPVHNETCGCDEFRTNRIHWKQKEQGMRRARGGFSGIATANARVTL
jgi:hypothetical protein